MIIRRRGILFHLDRVKFNSAHAPAIDHCAHAPAIDHCMMGGT